MVDSIGDRAEKYQDGAHHTQKEKENDMKKEFIEKVRKYGTIDTRSYRYRATYNRISACKVDARIERLPLSDISLIHPA